MRGNIVHLAKLKYNKQICTEVLKSSELLARNISQKISQIIVRN